MRALLVCYGYNREGRSESHTAYLLAEELRRYHEITVLTKDHPINYGDIQVKTPLLSRFHSTGAKIEYIEFNLKSLIRINKIKNKFDLIHHVSPLSFRYPDLLCNLGRPFIWGPIGGSLKFPEGFEHIEQKGRFGKNLHKLDQFRLNHDPFLKNTMKNSKHIIVTTSAAKSMLPSKHKAKTTVIPEGISLEEIGWSVGGTAKRSYIFSSGRLVPYKAFDLLIKAYAKIHNDTTIPELRITGEGPERPYLENLISELGLADRIKLLGKVPKSENQELMRRSQFCVFPALNEAFGHVNLEAMALGKPIIVTDWGGPADIVHNEITGFKVIAKGEDDYVDILSKKIKILVENADLREKMGLNSRKRVKEVFAWDAIGERYNALYNQV